MEHSQFTKFSPITVLVKRTIRKLRIDAGHSMNEGARLLGVSRKQLEDIETIRNYGCHLDLELLAKIKVIYRTSLDEIVGELPDDYYSEYFERPRKRLEVIVSTNLSVDLVSLALVGAHLDGPRGVDARLQLFRAQA